MARLTLEAANLPPNLITFLTQDFPQAWSKITLHENCLILKGATGPTRLLETSGQMFQVPPVTGEPLDDCDRFTRPTLFFKP